MLQARVVPRPANCAFAIGGYARAVWDRWLRTGPVQAKCGLIPDYTVSMGSSQMPELLAELDRLSSHPVKPVERRGLDRLRVLAETCNGSSVLSLSFIGD